MADTYQGRRRQSRAECLKQRRRRRHKVKQISEGHEASTGYHGKRYNSTVDRSMSGVIIARSWQTVDNGRRGVDVRSEAWLVGSGRNRSPELSAEVAGSGVDRKVREQGGGVELCVIASMSGEYG